MWCPPRRTTLNRICSVQRHPVHFVDISTPQSFSTSWNIANEVNIGRRQEKMVIEIKGWPHRSKVHDRTFMNWSTAFEARELPRNSVFASVVDSISKRL